ncbi:hypothetical protein P692DRAFT_201804166 [Suillus brevipes Sb2]|nr:hypothetical protein P692DRAFT_201804166 [Suillus brevipes Sb2]
MPSLAEDSDDFTAALDAVEDTDSEYNDEQDSKSGSDAGSDLGTLRTILTVPQPDAPMHEVRKALEAAQRAYTAVRSELRVLKKDYATLQAAIPPRSRNRVLKKTSTVDSSISRAGKINARWSSSDAKLKGAMAELYFCVPKTLHKAMETYTQFGPLFRAAVSSERSNILHVIKDCAGLIFSGLKLDPTTLTDEPSKKKENEQLLALIKKNGEGEYTRLAPILFKDPSVIMPDDFLMSPVLVKIIRVEMFWKAVLSGKTKGHPKARGQRWATQCVTEGMIAGTAILARFLLSHDHELTAIGPATRIEYQQDFDFYLERLFKRSSWAISVMDYYNREVFGSSSESSPSAAAPSVSHSHSWEDDFLQQLDSEGPARPPTLAPALVTPPAPNLIPLSAPTPTLSVAAGGAASASATINTQLQADIGQLSLEDSTEPSASTGKPKSRRAPAAATHKRQTAAQKAQLVVDSNVSLIIPLGPPPVVKRVTRNGGGRTKKAAGKTK